MNLISKALHSVGKVSPLVWIIAYIAAIPIFGLVYFQVPRGFYAPYAKLEPGAGLDRQSIHDIVQRSVRKTFDDIENGRSKRGILLKSLPIQVDTVRLNDLNIVEDQIKAKFSVLFSGLDGSDNIIFGYDLFDVDLWAGPMDPKGKFFVCHWTFDVSSERSKSVKAYLDGVASFGSAYIGSISSEEAYKVSHFIAGSNGDPALLSNGMLRMMYYSVVVITTLGFGDIVPLTNTARLLTACEAMLGIILVGLFFNSVATRMST